MERKRTHTGYVGGNLRRQEAVGMDVLVKEFIKSLKLASGLNARRVFEAWDKVSGAGKYTVALNYRNGILYCSMSSSVVRSQLYLQKDIIRGQINKLLLEDEMYTAEPGKDRCNPPVKDIILK